MKPLLKEDVYMKIWNKTVPSDNLGRKANEDLKLVVFHTIYKDLNFPLHVQIDFQIHQPLHIRDAFAMSPNILFHEKN